MLPITNSGPASYSATATTPSAAQSLATQTGGDNAAAARQFLPGAVTASAAPAAYFPGTAPQRQAQEAAKPQVRVPVPPPTGDYILIDNAPAVAPAVAATRPSGPVTLGIPLTTQLTAQLMAQQQQAAAITGEAEPMPEEPAPREAAPAKTKDSSFATARGAKAYNYAAARSAGIIARPDIEAV